MTREDALEIIRKNMPSDKSLPVYDALQTLIPELNESEDERIRKALIWHLKTDMDFVSNGVTKAECLAYLEKQKPATFYVPDDADLSHPRNKLAFMLGQYRKQGHINEEEYWQMLKYLIEKEPKSSQTDTEKEYVRTLKSLISDFLHGKQEIDTEYYQQIYDWLDEIHIEQKVLPGFDGLTPEEKMNHPLYLEGFDVGRDVQKVFDEQKPADDKAFEEWIDSWWKHNKVNNPDSYDKGDEIQFDERGFKNFCRGIRNMYAWQKPAEWSKEDEKQIAQIERIVKNAGCTKMLQEKIHIWLKSLRPSWKPSEEQMEALERCIDYLDESDNDDFGIMLTLYEQLEKL